MCIRSYNHTTTSILKSLRCNICFFYVEKIPERRLVVVCDSFIGVRRCMAGSIRCMEGNPLRFGVLEDFFYVNSDSSVFRLTE